MGTSVVRGLWLTCVLLASVIIGTGGGLLTYVAGLHPALAVIAGFGGFAAAVQLLITITTYATGPRNSGPGN
ncbi:hypothetical protein [Dactylosporangium sp. NPDC051541]|uniref:hypothetical protein n=1 Tax=Dactylosporangium sp. NPDC051541 TaxID=3363977 RepID=UPI003798D14E